MKRFLFTFGLLIVTLSVAKSLPIVPTAHAFTYVDLIGDFCEQKPDQDVTTNSWNIYSTEYCGMERAMEDEVLGRVAEQLEATWFFGLLLDRAILEDVVNGRDIDVTELPEAVYQKYFNKTPEEQAQFFDLIEVLYRQEQAIQWSKDSLKSEFEASEVWANGSLLDSPFDLIHDLNLIEVLLFGSKATLTGPRDAYAWPKNEEEDSALGTPDGIPPPNADGATAAETPSDASPTDSTSESSPDGATPSAPADCVPVTPEDDENDSPTNNNSPPPATNDQTNPACLESGGLQFQPYQPQNASSGSASPPFKGGVPPEAGRGSGGPQCPPGSRPRQPDEPATPLLPPSTADLTSTPTQPSPFIGGVLKPLGPNPKSACPPPGIEIEVNIAGRVEKQCINWVPCADYNDVRRLLNKEEPEKLDFLEVAFCINIEKIDRPETTYPLEEGCIACHVEGITDTLYKINEQNVTPLVNPMMASGTSNKFGPVFFFNLTAFTKSVWDLVLPWGVTTAEDVRSSVDAIEQDVYKQLDPNEKRPMPPNESIFSRDANLNEVIGETRKILASQKEQYTKALEALKIKNQTTGKSNYWKTVSAGLGHLNQSFKKINDRLIGVASRLQFKEKPWCEAK